MESTTTTTTSSSSTTNEIEQQQYYLSRIKPWCLGQQYDYCPLMIIIMIVVILISVILITILCIHNQKPYITRLLINYIINKKNRIFRCNKNGTGNQANNTTSRQNSHSAIHNSIFWVDHPSSTVVLNQQAPPSYEESVLRKPVYLTSILAPIATSVSSSSGYNTATLNDAFSCDDLYIVPQVRQQQQYRETAIDTAIDLPENNYYENRRTNNKNLSFMSTDSFHFINTSASRQHQQQASTSSTTSLQTVPSTLRSDTIEYPPAYDTLLVNSSSLTSSSFNKVNDIDNLNKFKKLQQKYQQSRKLYYQQRHQHQNNRQSTATILSEVEIIV